MDKKIMCFLLLIVFIFIGCDNSLDLGDPAPSEGQKPFIGLNPEYEDCHFKLSGVFNGINEIDPPSEWFCLKTDADGVETSYSLSIFENGDLIINGEPVTWRQGGCRSFDYNNTTAMQVIGSALDGAMRFKEVDFFEAKEYYSRCTLKIKKPDL